MAFKRILLRRDTSSNWTSGNAVLSSGEIGYETNTGKFKIGNGSTAWTSLAYSITTNLAASVLNDFGDVTITSAADGDFLRWNGTAWINDAVNLSTDTIGSFVQSLVAGTGVTLSGNSGENATPTVNVDTTVIQARVANITDTEIGYLNGVTSAIQTQIDTKAPLASPTFTGTVTVPTPVNNTDASTKTYVDSTASTTASNAATALTNHEADTTNIHGIADTSILVTTTGTQTLTNKTITTPAGLVKGDVGLGNVDNTADTAKPVSTAQQTALDLKANLASPTFTGTVTIPTGASITAPTGLVKGDVGLGSVDNTADTAKPVSTAQQTALDLKANLASPTFTGTVTVPTPTNSTDAATKAYADAIAAGINWHESVKLATATVLSGTPTYSNGTSGLGATLTATANARLSIDGTNATTNDRVLVKNQANTVHNGIYKVTDQGSASTPYILTRAVDQDGVSDNVVRGDATYVADGSVNASQGFLISSSGTSGESLLHVIGTDPITFTQFTGTANITTGTGVTKTGNTLSIGQSVATTDNVTFTQVTAALVGNASTATTLATARNIAGQSFDGSGNISIGPTDLTGVTSTAGELNILDGATLTVTELNYVDGVTSAIQIQIDLKAPSASPTFTGTVTVPTPVNDTDAVTKAYVDGEVSGATINTLDEIGDVTITSATTGDFLKWSGTAFVNDQIDLGTDTVGNYVSGVTAGTGITVTHTPSEGSSPTIAVTANTFDAFGAASTAASNAGTALSNHEADTTNIHGIADTSILVTTTGTQTLTNKTITAPSGLVKGDVGLGNVDNTADTAKPVSTAGQTALDLKANLASPTFTGTVTIPTGGSITAPTGLVKGDVGLGSVDNTADTAKPVSTAQQTALDLKANLASPTFTGTPTLPTGTIATTQTAANNTTAIATTAYVDTAVANLVDSAPATLNTLDELALALGDDPSFATTVATNIGLKAPLASPTFTGTVTIPTGASITAPTGLVKGDVGLSSVDNTADTAKPVSTAQQTALDLKANLASPTFTGTPTLPTGTIATTQTAANNTTAIATTAYVDTADNLKANLASPTFTGTVTLPSGTVTSTMILDDTILNADINASAAIALSKLATSTAGNIIVYSSAGVPTSVAETGDVTISDTGVTAIASGVIVNADVSTTAAIDLNKLADVSTSAQTASYTLVLADKNKVVEMNVATGNTLTVPTEASVAFPVGSQIRILQTGAGQCTLTAAAGVTVNSTPGLKLRTQFSSATLLKRATNTWVALGDLSA